VVVLSGGSNGSGGARAGQATRCDNGGVTGGGGGALCQVMVGGFGGRFITGSYRGARWVAVRLVVDGGEVAVAPPQPWAVGRAGGAELADVEEDEEERRGRVRRAVGLHVEEEDQREWRGHAVPRSHVRVTLNGAHVHVRYLGSNMLDTWTRNHNITFFNTS
jgi:hypothetical protein